MSDKKEMPHFTLEVVKWEGRLHCCYLNSFRIAGSKPWAGGETVKSWPVPLRDLVRAIPELRKMEEDRDTAISQLAALLEELDGVRQGLEATRIARDAEQYANEELRKRLADAERRNALTVDWQDRMFSEMERRFGLRKHIDDDHMVYDDTQIGVEFAIKWISAALNKPEEAKS